MDAAKQKKVLVGVSGCIAAYKAVEVVRGFQKAGWDVAVVMTENATRFIAPLTFRALTHHPVEYAVYDETQDPMRHISLAEEADCVLIAPCTANVLAKLACGIADDLLTSTVLASRAPLYVAPAMNVNMYNNAATRHNMQILRERGVSLIEPDEGYLACGYTGKGRLANPDRIVAHVLECESHLHTPSPTHDLTGKYVLITAGPTVEPIDPVRFISNRSSGKFGYALAQAAAKRGAQVSLISGPVHLVPPAGVEVVSVTTACEMMEAAKRIFPACDIALFAAAVADVRPAVSVSAKLKKGRDDASLAQLSLVPNPDILATLAAQKTHQIVVGFAAETHDVVENATEKLIRKQADLIVANQVGDKQAFGQDDNEIYLVTSAEITHLPRASKEILAHRILDKVKEF